MSQTVALILAALVGAIIALVGTYYARLRDEFKLRLGALKVLLDDLGRARWRMKRALETDCVWPAGEQVVPKAWSDYRSTLASHLKPKTWDAIQALVLRLEEADRRADELRAAHSVLDEQFRADLADLAATIGVATEEYSGSIAEQLNEGVSGARRLPRVLGTVLAIAVLVVILGGLALAVHKPFWTADRLKSTLRPQTPGAQVVACDASNQIEGVFTCTAAFPTCAFGLISANRDTKCSPALEITYNVQTQKHCYIADGSVDPPPPSLQARLRKFLKKWGCIQP